MSRHLYAWFGDIFFRKGEIYFSPVPDLKKKLDGYCLSGNKNETEVYAIFYQPPCHLVSLISNIDGILCILYVGM